MEIYFEHRNYLPTLSICFGLSYLFIYVFISVYCLLIVTVSVIKSRAWSRPAMQAMKWARLHPTSVRALDDLAVFHVSVEDYEHAPEVYDRISTLQPGDMCTTIRMIKIIVVGETFNKVNRNGKKYMLRQTMRQLLD